MSVLTGGGCGWIQLATGRKFRVPAFDPDEITIEDVAHSLSMQCRYAGHCLQFYSVAEHSVHIYRNAPRHSRKPALMHDAPESIVTDVVRSVKDLLTGYREIEHQVALMMAKKWCIEYPWPDEVKVLDNRILLDERAQNMPRFIRADELVYNEITGDHELKSGIVVGPAGYEWCAEEEDGWPFALPPLNIKLEFWTPAEAKEKFLEAFHECG